MTAFKCANDYKNCLLTTEGKYYLITGYYPPCVRFPAYPEGEYQVLRAMTTADVAASGASWWVRASMSQVTRDIVDWQPSDLFVYSFMTDDDKAPDNVESINIALERPNNLVVTRPLAEKEQQDSVRIFYIGNDPDHTNPHWDVTQRHVNDLAVTVEGVTTHANVHYYKTLPCQVRTLSHLSYFISTSWHSSSCIVIYPFQYSWRWWERPARGSVLQSQTRKAAPRKTNSTVFLLPSGAA